MHSNAIKKTELINEINMVPDDKLDEIKDFVVFVLSKSQKKENRKTLKRIWKDKGFEKISNIENEIHTLRKNISNYKNKNPQNLIIRSLL